MSDDYVKINTSTTDIISAANTIVTKAAALSEAMGPLIAHINSYENPGVLGDDDFAAKFNKNYHSTGTGSDVSASCKQACTGDNSFGSVGQSYGNSVISAMFDYSDTDGDSSAAIDGTTSTT